MYLSDFHLHSRWSPDSVADMRDMARVALDRGFRELCFTDHVEVMNTKCWSRNRFDWPALSEAVAAARAELGDRIAIRLGAELGEAPRDFGYAEELLAQMPPMDFIIGSIHQLSDAFGCEDLATASTADPELSRRQITDYLALVWKLAKWGKFSVLGHLTLPLRYMNERAGGHMTFDGYEAEVEEIYRALIQSGCGIELNVNRGRTPLPDEKWLKLYRDCGGEIITVGTDAHRPADVGRFVPERLELLKACGFKAYCTFEARKPVFHDL